MKNRIPQPDATARPALAVTLYGAVHLLVDLASIGVLYSAVRSGLFSELWVALLILFYDYLAFASQMFLGLALDRLGLSGHGAAAGCVITAAGLWLGGVSPVAAVAVVALGNALFHVGGGIVSLKLAPGRALWPGLFVAPGAIGLFLGKLAAGSGLYHTPWALTALLCLGAIVGLLLQAPKRTAMALFPAMKGFGLVVAALLVTVAVRSLVGFSVSYPWATGWPQALLLTLAAVTGKALGGALGDRLGWRAVTCAGLVLSAPLLAFGQGIPALAIAGVALFNLTMAITVASLAAMLPGYEGLAFGLTTMAIAVGLTPSFLGEWAPVLRHPAMLLSCILLSAAALWAALGRHLQASINAKPAGAGASALPY